MAKDVIKKGRAVKLLHEEITNDLVDSVYCYSLLKTKKLKETIQLL